jgi:hypothetical protein
VQTGERLGTPHRTQHFGCSLNSSSDCFWKPDAPRRQNALRLHHPRLNRPGRGVCAAGRSLLTSYLAGGLGAAVDKMRMAANPPTPCPAPRGAFSRTGQGPAPSALLLYSFSNLK